MSQKRPCNPPAERTQVTTYSYDRFNRLLTMTDPAVSVSDYTVDSAKSADEGDGKDRKTCDD